MNNFSIWAVSTLGSSAAIVFALWLLRKWIAERLSRSIQHEFDLKLEAIKGVMRESDERLKADLQAKGQEIAQLRGGALSAMASRQMMVDKRRLEAIDQLWVSVSTLAPARYIAMMMGSVKFEAAAKAAENDPRLREVFSVMGTGFDHTKIDHSSAAKARPFVSATVWASYSALLSVCMFAVFRWIQLKGGLGPADYGNHDAIKKVLKTALPQYNASYIDGLDPSSYHLLIVPLEEKLLESIEAVLAGEAEDKAAVDRAHQIVKYTQEALGQQMQAATNPP